MQSSAQRSVAQIRQPKVKEGVGLVIYRPPLQPYEVLEEKRYRTENGNVWNLVNNPDGSWDYKKQRK